MTYASLLTIFKFIKGLNLKTIAIILAVLIGAYFIYDYVDTKKIILENKIAKKNQEIKDIRAEYIKNIVIMHSKIEEQQIQKNDLINHNKLLTESLQRKSNVNTKDKNFNCRNISKFTF